MKRKTNTKTRMAAAQMHALAAVRRDIRSRDSSGGCKYLRDFNNSYRNYERVLSSHELDDRVCAASLVLLGDYHALPASQKFAAGLIEQVAQRSRVVLGVEAVLSRDQQHLEYWWRREINEETLRERLRFDREWGYDWPLFYELLIAAREHSEGVYGLDCMPRNDLRSLHSRDRHAAAKIRELRQRHSGAVIVVVFGESHMAPQHLPAVVRKLLPEERALTVLQNIDSLYWKAAREKAAAVSLSDDAVCVFNSSPLEKYESYRLCLERWNGASFDDAPDFTPAVYNLIFSLARSLGFRLDSPHNGTQPKFLADSLPEVVAIEEGREQGTRLDERASAYSPEDNTIYIREFNVAAVAAEVARFLHCACTGRIGQRSSTPGRQATLAQFAARLLCPGTIENQEPDQSGEELYQNYLAGRISRAAIRQMFLGR